MYPASPTLSLYAPRVSDSLTSSLSVTQTQPCSHQRQRQQHQQQQQQQQQQQRQPPQSSSSSSSDSCCVLFDAYVPVFLPPPFANSRTLFIDNLPASIDNRTGLVAHVPPTGLVSLRVKRTSHTTPPRNVAFAQYNTQDAARRAMRWFFHTAALRAYALAGSAHACAQVQPPLRMLRRVPHSSSSSLLLPYRDYDEYARHPELYATLLIESTVLMVEWSTNEQPHQQQQQQQQQQSLQQQSRMQMQPLAASLLQQMPAQAPTQQQQQQQLMSGHTACTTPRMPHAMSSLTPQMQPMPCSYADAAALQHYSTSCSAWQSQPSRSRQQQQQQQQHATASTVTMAVAPFAGRGGGDVVAAATAATRIGGDYSTSYDYSSMSSCSYSGGTTRDERGEHGSSPHTSGSRHGYAERGSSGPAMASMLYRVATIADACSMVGARARLCDRGGGCAAGRSDTRRRAVAALALSAAYGSDSTTEASSPSSSSWSRRGQLPITSWLNSYPHHCHHHHHLSQQQQQQRQTSLHNIVYATSRSAAADDSGCAGDVTGTLSASVAYEQAEQQQQQQQQQPPPQRQSQCLHTASTTTIAAAAAATADADVDADVLPVHTECASHRMCCHCVQCATTSQAAAVPVLTTHDEVTPHTRTLYVCIARTQAQQQGGGGGSSGDRVVVAVGGDSTVLRGDGDAGDEDRSSGGDSACSRSSHGRADVCGRRRRHTDECQLLSPHFFREQFDGVERVTRLLRGRAERGRYVVFATHQHALNCLQWLRQHEPAVTLLHASFAAHDAP